MYTTLEAFKTFAGFDDDADEELLSALLLSATQIIQDYTGRCFEAVEYAQDFNRCYHLPNRFDGRALYFYEELAEEASAITDSPTVLYIPEDGPPYYGIYLTEGSWAYPTVTVTGFWGFSITPPPAIQHACLRLAKWLYDTRDTSRGTAVVVTPEGQVLLPQGFPTDVVQILKPYRKIEVA
jgi:hypothetical protein